MARSLFVSLSICLCMLPGLSWGQEPEFVDSSLAEILQQTLDDQYAEQFTTGFTAAVSMPDERIWFGTAGMSNPSEGQKFRTDHRIGFASITKTFTAALILQLVDEGRLSLEDTISSYLPAMTFINGDVTIRQLLNHQSGIYNFTNHPNLVPFAENDIERHWTPEELLATFLDTPVFSPGNGSGYSNTNYILLGMIANVVTEKKISTLFRERFLDPNGLNATYLGSEEPATGDIVTTWFDTDSDGSIDDNSVFFDARSYHSLRWTGGGMISIPGEIARWAKILFKGDVLEASTREEMLTFLPISGTGSVWTGYGLGVQEYQIVNETFWGHSGGLRGAVSLMVYSPDYDISIAVAANDNRANHVLLVGALFEAALTSLRPTAIEKGEETPLKTSFVSSVYPNPFNDTITLNYHLEHVSSVEFQVHDLLGREIKSSHLSVTDIGEYVFEWDGRDASGQVVRPGVYLYSLTTKEGRVSGTVIKHP